MQYSYRPAGSPSPERGKGQRRGLPISAPALAGIAIIPLLLVALWLFWPDGDDPASPPSASAEQVGEGTPAPGGNDEGDRNVAAESTTAPSQEATPTPEAPVAALPLGDPPVSLGNPAPEISAEAAVVIDDASMEVLYEKNAHERRAPASTTKIATAIVAVESRPLHEEVTSTVHYWRLAMDGDATTMGLQPDDVLTLRQLLYGLLLVSGNDAAAMIAQHITGGAAAYVERMNALAARLGLQDTRFTNVDGLSDPGHYSSAWDLAVLSRYLMRFPDLRAIVGTEHITMQIKRNGQDAPLYLYNHNPLLNYTPGVDGVKTGFTEEAGQTFSVTAERDGHRVYIVILDTEQRARDSQALIEWAFQNHRWPE